MEIKNLLLNLVVLWRDHILSNEVFYCSKKRCQNKEKKEPNSTRLKFIKSWIASGKGGNYNKWGLFECPVCEKRYRKHLGSGRDQKE